MPRELGWLTSLALQTDLLILGSAAQTDVTDACISVRTPSLPQLRIGNAVLFPQPPGPEDVTTWIRRLELEVGESAAKYGRIAWEGGPPTKDVYQDFKSAGFEPYDSLSMQATALRARPGGAILPVRAARSDSEWGDLLDFHLQANQVVSPGDREFLAARLDLYRSESEAGNGAWFTAYADGRVVGCCGIALGDDLARLQGLETSTGYRRAGLGLSLVKAASEWAYRHAGTRRLVSVVDPGYHARRLFESVGFQDQDLACGVVPIASFVSPAV
ncbi:GNAT family N-acetyltransferase [Streptomyces sp. NPDC096339]|uniref:GNAT family N-acetyltransferase n=1 Tax=Streptomyces sp. NPDC096339 TaxID=3366086 RepID=UPI0037F5E713